MSKDFPNEIINILGLMTDFETAFHLKCETSTLLKLNGNHQPYKSMETLLWLLSRYKITEFNQQFAIYDLECLKLLHIKGLDLTNDVFYMAVATDRALDILSYLYELGFSLNCGAIASSIGNLSTMKWLHSKGLLKDPMVMEYAAQRGDLINLEWLLQFDFSMDHFVFAAAVEHPLVLNWLYKNKCPMNYHAMHRAATLGDLGTIKWLFDRHCEMHAKVFEQAIYNQDLSIIEWLYSHNCPIENAMETAIGTGNLRIVKYLFSKGLRWRNADYTFMLAVRYAGIDVMQWLFEHGAKPNIDAMHAAIQLKKVEKIKYLLEIHCPWNQDILAFISKVDISLIKYFG